MRTSTKTAGVRQELTITLGAFSPRRLLLYGFVFWVAVRLSIFFIDFDVTPGVDAILAVAGYLLSFLVGTLLVPVRRAGEESRHVGTPHAYQRAAVLLIALAVTFLCLRVYDLVFNRGFLDANSIAEFRALENTIVDEARTTGGISFVSGIGYPIAVPVLLFVLAYRRHLTSRIVGSAYLLGALYAGYVVASGNRQVLVVPVMMALIVLVIVRGGLKMTPRRIGELLVVAAITFTYLTYGTLQRDVLFGAATSDQALQAAPDRKLFTPNRNFMQVFRALPITAQDVVYGYIDVAWYVTHGWYEFVKIVDFADPNDRAWGGAQFVTALYLFRTIGLDVAGEEKWRRNLPTYGFYSTFFGPLYLDFGIAWGMAYCILLGIIAQRLWQGALRRQILGMLMYPFAAGVLLNVPTNNLILAGLGLPILGMTLVVAGIVGVAERMATSGSLPGGRRRVGPAATEMVNSARTISAAGSRRNWA